MSTLDSLNKVYETLELQRKYAHAAGIISFDRQTVCPPAGMGEQGETLAFLSNEAFKLSKDEAYIKACEDIYAHSDELDEFDRTLARIEHRDYLATKNITPEKDMEFSLVYNKAFDTWLEAREKSDYSIFENSLAKVIDVCREQVHLREPDPDDDTDFQSDYDYTIMQR
jgi:carboxypeptidase Taq